MYKERVYVRRKRIMIAGLGQDNEIRTKAISRVLRDAGCEVIYAGVGNTIDVIVSSAMQEDVDAIGVGFYSDYSKKIISELTQSLGEKEMSDVSVFVDGTVPDKDLKYLRRRNVDAVFSQETDLKEIAEYIKTIERKERKSFFQKLYGILLSLE